MKFTRKEPQLLFSLPRFIHRLQREFPEKERSILEKRLYNMQAGYSGEKRVDDYLTLIPNLKSTIILTDVRLPLNSGSSFQIDTLIIAPQYILILEVKNIKDNLSFITNPHYLLKELDGNESSIECPITQLTLAKMNLKEWLFQQGIRTKVYGKIILANPSAIIKEIPDHSPVLHMKRLALLLQEKENLSPIFNDQQLQNIASIIRKHQYDYHLPSLCDYFNVDPKIFESWSALFKLFWDNHL